MLKTTHLSQLYRNRGTPSSGHPSFHYHAMPLHHKDHHPLTKKCLDDHMQHRTMIHPMHQTEQGKLYTVQLISDSGYP